MKLRVLISLSLLAAASAGGAALWNADDYFHGGAQLYLSNNIPLALTNVERGLKLFPEDPKLKKLEEILKRQNRQQQEQQQQDSQQNQQQNQDQQQSQKNEEQEKKESEQPKQDTPQQNEQQQKQSGDQKEQSKDEPRQGQPRKGQMTPEQAERLMDAQKGDEKMLPVKPEKRTTPPLGPVKDW